MASGCIIGNCWVCNEFIWEDEPWEIIGGEMVHRNCVTKITGVYRELNAIKDRAKRLETILTSHSKDDAHHMFKMRKGSNRPMEAVTLTWVWTIFISQA
ncbi:hypothetical protein [Moorella sp. Hama-1]|uniref:hypothetical protein n=1 Tax=Moorella sp. Hama-1 TaxID=2138101 RepID=UPI00129005C8|nr:hypothetical protein [Moorella sp. Hama-1]BCV21028.1 hypothetical protein hamaS1_10970 [Moorella sp. Hama-1]